MAHVGTIGEADVRMIAQLPLFEDLAPEQLQSIVHASRACRLQKGETLFQKGDQARGFYVVVSGQIKLLFRSLRGVEKVVEILGPGQSFGEALMFNNRPYPLSAEAVLDVALLEVPQRTVFDLLDRDPTFARAMLAGLARRLHSLVQDVEGYTMRSGAQRVIGYLLQQAADAERGSIEVVLPTSKSLIASRLNLTPETLSRVFHELEESGLLEVHGRHVVIRDVQSLRTFEP